MTQANTRGSILAQVDQRWLSIALAAAGGVAAAPANAAIVYHAPVGGINIPSTFAGTYINMENEAFGANSTPGWDINPYGVTYLRLFQATGAGYIGNANGYANLAPGTPITAGSAFSTANRNNDPAFPLSLGTANNLVGFRFVDGGSVTRHGWFRISLGATQQAQPRSIVEWAYETDPNATILAGQIPAPGSLALLAAGGLGLIGRRRKTA